ncbi:hypothetical protein HXW94_15310 [Desulfobacter latus]|uniref:Uncharacterized protein n=1 Tax=Desulfobacter latus TaxID=2292 RepID=A0A850T3K1_9BACT|nr:hypothetical protein [Desulfobacter latus]
MKVEPAICKIRVTYPVFNLYIGAWPLIPQYLSDAYTPFPGYNGFGGGYLKPEKIFRAKFFQISLKSSTGFGYISESASAAVTAGEFLSKIDGWLNGWKKCLNVAPFIIKMKNWKAHPLNV